jgi:hypothetical protein
MSYSNYIYPDDTGKDKFYQTPGVTAQEYTAVTAFTKEGNFYTAE